MKHIINNIFSILTAFLVAISLYIVLDKHAKYNYITNINEVNSEKILQNDSVKIESLDLNNFQIKETSKKLPPKKIKKNLDNKKVLIAIDHTKIASLDIVNAYLLIEHINAGYPFINELKKLRPRLKTIKDITLAEDLMANVAYKGIPSTATILDQYELIREQTYKKFLYTNKTLASTLKYLLAQFFSISYEADNFIEIKEPNTSKQLQYVLNNVRLYIERNEMNNAYREFLKIDVLPNNTTRKWLNDLMNKEKANELNNLLLNIIENKKIKNN